MTDLGILILRMGLGVMFFSHGLQLTFGFFKGPGIEGFSKMLSGLGIVQPLFWAYVAAYSTLIAGLCLIAGLLTRLATVPLIIFMLVAVLTVHIKKGFFISNGGYEYNFVVICALIAILILGPGHYSILNKF